MKDTRMIYYPSLSASNMIGPLKKNDEIHPGLTFRFYSKDHDPDWYWPYFLITAGHHYKKMDTREQFGCNEPGIQVMGDSGGFQLATGQIKWDGKIVDTIFRWLEANSDVAVNLDIPPRANFEGKFKECLDISYDNFKYFANNQTGATDFLNVIQGNNLDQYEEWYMKVKDFDFNGWCIGGTKKVVNLMEGLAVLIKNREFEKPNVKYLHFLGVTKVTDFIILSYIQNILNKQTGGRVQVSTDSSSPSRHPSFGHLLYQPNMRTLSFDTFYLPKEREDYYTKGVPIPNPYEHPYYDSIDFTDFNGKWDTTLYAKMVMNNLAVFLKTADITHEFSQIDLHVMETIITNKHFIKVLKGIDEVFSSGDPYHAYKTYRPHFVKFNGGNNEQTNQHIINQFFETV